MKRRGFTLIELLVVIAIIALLISVLLPALTSARRMGQRTTCAAGLKSMCEAATLYGTDNEEWVPGSPSGSGGYLYNRPIAYGPAVQRWDFMGVMAQTWGISLLVPDGTSAMAVGQRFEAIVETKPFICPSNKYLALHNNGPDVG